MKFTGQFFLYLSTVSIFFAGSEGQVLKPMMVAMSQTPSLCDSHVCYMTTQHYPQSQMMNKVNGRTIYIINKVGHSTWNKLQF